MLELQPLLRLLQLSSPSLPVGAYAYSQGLEYAVCEKWLTDDNDVHQWISGQLHNNLAHNDAAIFHRLYSACQSGRFDEMKHWDALLFALRETAELQQEDQHLCRALTRLLSDLNVPLHDVSACCFLTRYVQAAVFWKITPDVALGGFLWSWCENQVAAAIKLVPLGQTTGQKLLSVLLKDIESVVHESRNIDDENIGLSLPALAMASAQHEQQYSRLFRS